jgi:DNA-directed RNA polymerase specialized sigma24 family protein
VVVATPEELVPEILDALPAAYGVLLLLLAGGATDEEVAARLSVPVETIPSMTEVARSKLRRLLGAMAPAAGD